MLFQNGSGIGIGRSPAGTLDVGGTTLFRGGVTALPIGGATVAAGANSYPIRFSAQGYNPVTGKSVTSYFQFQSESTGNNTGTPGATLNLLYFSGVGAGATETGLYFNPDGTIQFAAGQTFPAVPRSSGPGRSHRRYRPSRSHRPRWASGYWGTHDATNRKRQR